MGCWSRWRPAVFWVCCSSRSAWCNREPRAARFDTTKAIADQARTASWSPTAMPHSVRQRSLSRSVGRSRRRRPATGGAAFSPARQTFRNRSTGCRRRPDQASRASEELRIAPPLERRRRRGLVSHPRASARGRGQERATVWTVSDETREHNRHESFFQDLQHAIDYLDHAPAGFFSAEPDGAIVYMNATLAGWLDYDLAQFAPGQLKVDDIIAADGGAMLIVGVRRAGRSDDATVRRRSEASPGAVPAGAHLSRVAFSSDGVPGPSRTLVINRAPGEIRGERGSARRRSSFCADLQFDADGDRTVDATGALLRPTPLSRVWRPRR